MNLSVDKLGNHEIINQKSIHTNKVSQRSFLNRVDDVYTPSFKGVATTKALKNTGMALLVTMFMLFSSCKPEKMPVVNNSVPEPQEVSQEDLEFSANARAKLESDPVLLQSCLVYMYEHSMFSGAEDLLTGSYPVEWKINITMACIMGDAEMKEWFKEQIG